MKNLNKIQKGFTMLELIFVIIVIGILASISLNSFKRDLRSQAINNILSSIRYTQHLALSDNKMDPGNSLWQKSLWTLQYKKCDGEWSYSIGSDVNLNGVINKNEAALSTIDNKLLFTNGNECHSDIYSDDIRIGEKLSIDKITTVNCGTRAISFDYLGRPHSNVKDLVTSNYSSFNRNDCIMTFKFYENLDLDPIILTIRKETGFASINNREGL